MYKKLTNEMFFKMPNLSAEMATKEYTDANTETPCAYDNTLQMDNPKIHAKNKHRIKT